MLDKEKDLVVICINDKGWPDSIPDSHRITVHQECEVIRITTNQYKKTKLILKGYDDLDLVTGGRFDGYSKERFIPKSLIDEIWEKKMMPQVMEILNKKK